VKKAVLCLSLPLLTLAGACGGSKSHNPSAPSPVSGSPVTGGPSTAAAPRTPDPGPGERLPLPDMLHVVEQVAREHPEALAHSCQSHGGSWEFMDRVVAELRRHDSRWAFNAKRGNYADPSHDAIFYHWGAGPDGRTNEGYVVDIIVGHCGDNPAPGWIDVTEPSHGACGYLFPR